VNVGQGNFANYDVSAAVLSSSETIGSDASYGHYHFLPDKNFRNSVVVNNKPSSGTYDVDLSGLTHFVNGLGAPYSYGGADLQFKNTPGQYNLSSNTLPPLDFYRNFPLNQITFVSFITNSGLGRETDVYGTVNSITADLVAPVPEASTTVSLGVMLALGGLVLMVIRARRRSRA